MAVDQRNATTGAPVFLETGAPEEGADLTTVAAFAAEVGTRLIGTSTQRNAYGYARRGLEWYDTTTNRVFIYSGTAWVESMGNTETDFVAIFNAAVAG